MPSGFIHFELAASHLYLEIFSLILQVGWMYNFIIYSVCESLKPVEKIEYSIKSITRVLNFESNVYL